MVENFFPRFSFNELLKIVSLCTVIFAKIQISGQELGPELPSMTSKWIIGAFLVAEDGKESACNSGDPG